MAALRRRLLAIEGRPHLVFFRHDEVMVHSPAAVADDVGTPGRARRHHQHKIRLPAADGVQVIPIGTLGP